MSLRIITVPRFLATKLPRLQKKNILRAAFRVTVTGDTLRANEIDRRCYHHHQQQQQQRSGLWNQRFNNRNGRNIITATTATAVTTTITPSEKFQSLFLFLPSKCFSTQCTIPQQQQQTAGPNMANETAREKAEAGKQEAEADLGVRLSGNDFARTQSVTWHRRRDGTTPDYEYREIGGSTEGVSIPGKRGRLVATRSRLLKLLIPLRPVNSDSRSMSADEPLALLIHPHQPLSYLERLIQAEVPPIEAPGITRPPDITFLAVNPPELEPHPTDPKRKPELVRWSTATEVGDFVRDASKGQEFVIVIEGRGELPVQVPSFEDRTYFLRQKLRELSVEIDRLSRLKQECDTLAHRSAQNLAVGGFACLTSWWAAVWYLTFHTSLGWDVMEPVTYLAGLTSIMLGYLWFLYHNREVSYRSVLHLTVSKRQIKLYAQKGFDLDHWQELLDEGKSLRKEIRGVADQYDVDWDESKDRVGERVKKALDGNKKDKKDDEDSDRDE